MMRANPMFWLLEVETYDFDAGVLKGAELTGKVMIISSQLWSLIRGDNVMSMLIGPGIFKGNAVIGNRRVDMVEYLSGLMFDPSQLRVSEPLPQVDIVNPEVIDPLEARKQEEIVTIIRKVIVERGNVLPGNVILRHRPNASIPLTAHALDLAKKINVSHVSGVQRARFILAGTNGPMYKPFVQHFRKRGFINPERLKVMATPFGRFSRFLDSEVMSDWMIVEKAGVDDRIGVEAIRAEYDDVLSQISRAQDKYIYEL